MVFNTHNLKSAKDKQVFLAALWYNTNILRLKKDMLYNITQEQTREETHAILLVITDARTATQIKVH